MNELVLIHAERWPLLLVPVVVLVLGILLERRRRRLLARFADVGAHPRLLVDAGPAKRGRRLACEVAGLVLLGIAALEPAYGLTTVEVERRGLEIAICLDTSRSMQASDLEPTRAERARRDILALLPALRGDRVALIAFAGDALRVCPLTHDLGALEGLLSGVDAKTTRKGGTDIASALKAALALLPVEDAPSQAILLLTDGEDLEGQGRSEATRARNRGVVVHAVGYGSAAGAKVPAESGGGFLLDPEGREVVSKLDAQGLRLLTRATGGDFLSAESVALPLVEVYEKRLVPMEQRRFESETRRRLRSRFQWPLIPGLVFLCLAFVSRGRLSGPRRAGSSPRRARRAH